MNLLLRSYPAEHARPSSAVQTDEEASSPAHSAQGEPAAFALWTDRVDVAGMVQAPIDGATPGLRERFEVTISVSAPHSCMLSTQRDPGPAPARAPRAKGAGAGASPAGTLAFDTALDDLAKVSPRMRSAHWQFIVGTTSTLRTGLYTFEECDHYRRLAAAHRLVVTQGGRGSRRRYLMIRRSEAGAPSTPSEVHAIIITFFVEDHYCYCVSLFYCNDYCYATIYYLF